MLTDELDIQGEAVRILAGPIDTLCRDLRCLANGYLQVVVVDYMRNAALLRFCDSRHTTDDVVHMAMREKRDAWGIQISRHDDRNRNAIYYAVVLANSPYTERPWAIYQDYVRPANLVPAHSDTVLEAQARRMLPAKGPDFIETAYVYAPYIPLFTTPNPCGEVALE